MGKLFVETTAFSVAVNGSLGAAAAAGGWEVDLRSRFEGDKGRLDTPSLRLGRPRLSGELVGLEAGVAVTGDAGVGLSGLTSLAALVAATAGRERGLLCGFFSLCGLDRVSNPGVFVAPT